MEFINNYDIFLFDMYGVLWSGQGFYEYASKTIKYLMDNGKIVYILSNAAGLSNALKKRFEDNNLSADGFVTSGDAGVDLLKKESLSFKNAAQCEKIYLFGKKTVELFDDTKYKKVDKPEDADFIYISVPQLTEEEYNNYKGDKSKLKKGKKGLWDSLDIDPFLPELEKIRDLNKPILNFNPDLKAQEIDVNSGEINYVFRQGSAAEYFRKNNSEVLELGKPNTNIYEYAFTKIKTEKGIEIDKTKIIMVGDTLRTDIKGANNAKIDSILFTKTGVTGEELKNGKKLEELFEREEAKPTFVLEDIKDLYNNLIKN